MAIAEDSNIILELKSIIDQHGPDYIHINPYDVHKHLIDTEFCDSKLANAILYVLVSDIAVDRNTDTICNSTDNTDDLACISLSKQIQHECSLNKKMSDRLAFIFISLYSDSNRKEWSKRKCEGLKQFLSDDFTITWEGYATWEPGGGYVVCHYNADIVLRPMTKIKTSDAELSKMVTKNPFISKEAISTYYSDKMKQYLDDAFEDYCTEDDYYQPVVEDFEIDYYVKDWCRKNNFRFISCDGSGTDDGYEPGNPLW